MDKRITAFNNALQDLKDECDKHNFCAECPLSSKEGHTCLIARGNHIGPHSIQITTEER